MQCMIPAMCRLEKLGMVSKIILNWGRQLGREKRKGMAELDYVKA